MVITAEVGEGRVTYRLTPGGNGNRNLFDAGNTKHNFANL